MLNPLLNLFMMPFVCIAVTSACPLEYTSSKSEDARKVSGFHTDGAPVFFVVQESYYVYREIAADSEEATKPLRGPNQWPPEHLVPG